MGTDDNNRTAAELLETLKALQTGKKYLYQTGDVVLLRSGSPPMTVCQNQEDGQSVQVAYFGENKVVHDRRFLPDMLILVGKAPKQ
jgi:uncharacterized protein YodC (DUF2158 family)